MEGSILKLLRLTTLLIITSFAVAGCGGSDSAPTETGTLAVIITDGPTDQYEQILITLTGMSLIGGSGGHQVVYDGPPITFDLLDLGDRADFAFSGEIIADDYSKIRLEVSQIELVDVDAIEPSPVELVALPADGHIDLNPQGPFTISAGQTTVVELDMDANRSFLAIETGNGGIRLRPVIFVNVYSGDFILPSKLVRVSGTVSTVTVTVTDTKAEKSVLLCSLHFAAQLGTPVVTSDPTNCVRVFSNESTSIFGADGLASDFQGISATDEMTAIGFLTPDGADALFSLYSVVMELGAHQPPSDTGWETLRGLVVSAQQDCDMVFDSEQCFDFKAFDTDIPVRTRLQATTRVFNSQGTELAHTDINDIDTGTVDGLRIINGTEELRAALVVLNSDIGETLVSGFLEGVDMGDPYDVLMVAGMAVCVNDETDILRILVDDEVVTIIDVLDRAAIDAAAGHMVDASGVPDEVATGCHIVADVVIIE
jgi:hypothetical protein